MSRRKRIHVEQGYYLLAQRASGDRPLLDGTSEVRLFTDVLHAACAASGVRIIAWCLLPASMALVVQIDSEPVGSFMRRLTSDYARRVNRRRRTAGHVFAQHHRSVVLSDDSWLFEAVRYVHWLPVLAGLSDGLTGYPHSTHKEYTKVAGAGRLLRQPVFQHLGKDAREAARRYRQVSHVPPASFVTRAFAFVGGLSRTPGRPLRDVQSVDPPSSRRALSLDALADLFVQHLAVKREEVFSSSRRRELVYVRALVTDHALRAGVATLAQASRYFRRDPSTLLAAMAHYRRQRPELFRPGSVQRLIALGDHA